MSKKLVVAHHLSVMACQWLGCVRTLKDKDFLVQGGFSDSAAGPGALRKHRRKLAMNVRSSPLRPPLALLWLLALLIGLISLPGCGGCRGSSTSAKAKTAEEKKKEEDALEELERRKRKLEKPKDDFEPLALRMLPSNDPSPSLKQPPIFVKPGHWTAISVTAKTNNFDFPGEIATFTERTITNEPLPVEDTTAHLSSWCPAILAKGQ